jgi:hypothetical protein
MSHGQISLFDHIRGKVLKLGHDQLRPASTDGLRDHGLARILYPEGSLTVLVCYQIGKPARVGFLRVSGEVENNAGLSIVWDMMSILDDHDVAKLVWNSCHFPADIQIQMLPYKLELMDFKFVLRIVGEPVDVTDTLAGLKQRRKAPADGESILLKGFHTLLDGFGAAPVKKKARRHPLARMLASAPKTGSSSSTSSALPVPPTHKALSNVLM